MHKLILSATAATALALAPAALAHGPKDHHGHTAQESVAQTETVVLGWGAHAFETVPDWCTPPEGDHYGATHGSAAVDSEGHIYVTLDNNQFGYGIAVYNSEGAFVRGIGPGLDGLHSLIYNEEDGTGYLYGTLNASRAAVKITLAGEVVYRLGPPMQSGRYENEGQYRPTGIAVAPNGNVYIADGYGRNAIHIYNSAGEYQSSFGEPGQGDGQFRTCHGLGIDLRGDEPRVLVCDRENRRLQYFTLEGEFISVSTTGLRRPCAVVFHGENAAVAELAGRAVVLDIDNNVVSVLGDQPVAGLRANFRVAPSDWVEGVFNAPHGLAYTNEGDLVIAEWNALGRIAYLRRIPEADAPQAPPEEAPAE